MTEAETEQVDESQAKYTPNVDDEAPQVDTSKIVSAIDEAMAQPPAPLAPNAGPPRVMSSPALAIWFDGDTFNRAVRVAGALAKAKGIVPDHLIGNPSTCFFVVEQALTWNMSPSFVARNCYSTPGGKIGYHGTLCQAVIEASGRLIGGVKFRFVGDWNKVQGKFRMAKSPKGRDYPVPTYNDKDEEGLAVFVSAQVRGESERRELEITMRECFPRNSTLWATSPKRQICYTAVRAFANLAVPGIFAGVTFDHESDDIDMLDVTPPRPLPPEIADQQSAPKAATQEANQTREAPGAKSVSGKTPSKPIPPSQQEPAPATATTPKTPVYHITDGDGVVHEFDSAAKASSVLEDLMRKAVPAGEKAVEGIWESNESLQETLRANGKAETADMLANLFGSCINAAADLERRKGATSGAAPVKWTMKESDFYPRQPTSPLQRGGSWMVWFPWFLEQAKALKIEEATDFFAQFKDEMLALKEKRKPDFAKIDEAVQALTGKPLSEVA